MSTGCHNAMFLTVLSGGKSSPFKGSSGRFAQVSISGVRHANSLQFNTRQSGFTMQLKSIFAISAASLPLAIAMATPVMAQSTGSIEMEKEIIVTGARSTVQAVDPRGVCKDGIPAERIIGCVVYPATELVAPGVVRHVEGDRFPLGELDGSISNRVKDLSDVFVKSGLKAPVLENIRNEIWLKLWGNLTFNPISALSHATLQDICQFPLGRELAANMMKEAQTVAEKLGASFRVSLEKRIEGAEKVGRHKTSMLQDVEAGRAIEIDALVGSVVELGQLTGVPTPTISAIYQASKLLAHTIETEKIAVRGIELPQV